MKPVLARRCNLSSCEMDEIWAYSYSICFHLGFLCKRINSDVPACMLNTWHSWNLRPWCIERSFGIVTTCTAAIFFLSSMTSQFYSAYMHETVKLPAAIKWAAKLRVIWYQLDWTVWKILPCFDHDCSGNMHEMVWVNNYPFNVYRCLPAGLTSMSSHRYFLHL